MTLPTAWPPPSLERLAEAADQLAARLDGAELRAQAFGLAAVIRSLGREQAQGVERDALQAALRAALQAGDERRVATGMLDLAALDSGRPPDVDWSHVTSG